MSDDQKVGGNQQQLSALERDRLIFLSFQASGPERGAWPIEIGTAQVQSDGSVRVQGNLIRPHPSWRKDLWSPASEQIHGLTLERLNSAPLADLIAAEFLELIAGLTLISNAPEFDGPCFDMLAATISVTDTFDILGYNAAIALFGFAGIKRAHAFLRGSCPSHRAGNDAARLAMAWFVASKGDADVTKRRGKM